MIEIKNLVIKYLSLLIRFDDHTFEDKKTTFITGKNGCGKTTLLKAISSLCDYEGTIKKSGIITYNAQEPILFDRSVYDNIIYPLKIRNLPITNHTNRIMELSKRLEIDYLLSKNALTLSAGEKMKVSFIRSIIFDPDYVLLDEPTTNLDLDSIEELTILIKELKDKITFIIVSHNYKFINDLKDVEMKIGENNVLRQIT